MPSPDTVTSMQTQQTSRSIAQDGVAAHWRGSLILSVEHQEARFRRAKKRWNLWYYTSMYGAVLFSAAAALALKWEGGASQALLQNTAALCATLAAILGTASSTGNFERRWSAARRARLGMQKLRVDLEDPSSDTIAVSSAYKRVLEEYEGAVVGNDP